MHHIGLRARLRYWFDTTMARGTPALIGLLTMAAFALVVVVSIAMIALEPQAHSSPMSTLWANLDKMFKLGVPEEGPVVSVTLLLVLALGGIFMVSALVGLLTSGLNRKLADLRKGRSTVIERGHTVVLGWSDQIYTIVAELAEGASTGRPMVAILAARDKVDMEDAIRTRLGKAKVRVACRTGSPMDAEDLRLVSPGTAGAVIVLSPPGDDDSFTIKVLLALTRLGSRGAPVVANVRDAGNFRVAQLAGGPQATVINEDETVARLIVQTSLQPGLSTAYLELLQFAGNEPGIRAEPRLAGATYGQALQAYQNAAPIGLVRGDGTVRLNPPARTVIAADDRLVVVAKDQRSVRLVDHQPVPVVEAAIQTPTRRPAAPRRVLVLGWNRRAGALLTELDRYVAPGSEILVVSDRGTVPLAIADLSHRLRHLLPNTKEGDTTSRHTLESLGVDDFDHIIVLNDDRLDAPHADARVFATLLQLRDMAGDRSRYSIVTEMRDDRDRALAEIAKVDDFIVSDRVISLLMTQIAAQPELDAVFGALFDAEDAEIYLRPAADFLRPGQPATFATVVEAARRRGESAIGYRTVGADTNLGMVLNPPKSTPVTLTAADQVVVVAHQ